MRIPPPSVSAPAKARTRSAFEIAAGARLLRSSAALAADGESKSLDDRVAAEKRVLGAGGSGSKCASGSSSSQADRLPAHLDGGRCSVDDRADSLAWPGIEKAESNREGCPPCDVVAAAALARKLRRRSLAQSWWHWRDCLEISRSERWLRLHTIFFQLREGIVHEVARARLRHALPRVDASQRARGRALRRWRAEAARRRAPWRAPCRAPWQADRMHGRPVSPSAQSDTSSLALSLRSLSLSSSTLQSAATTVLRGPVYVPGGPAHFGKGAAYGPLRGGRLRGALHATRMAPAALVSTVRQLAVLCCWSARTRREARLIASVAALARRRGRRAAYRALRWWAVERRRERGRLAMWALAVEVSLERAWACWRRYSVKEARRARASSAPVLWALAPWARAVRSTTVQRLRRSCRRWVRRYRSLRPLSLACKCSPRRGILPSPQVRRYHADAPLLHSHRQGMRAAGRFRKRTEWVRLKAGAAADAERWRRWANVEAIALAHRGRHTLRRWLRVSEQRLSAGQRWHGRLLLFSLVGDMVMALHEWKLYCEYEGPMQQVVALCGRRAGLRHGLRRWRQQRASAPAPAPAPSPARYGAAPAPAPAPAPSPARYGASPAWSPTRLASASPPQWGRGLLSAAADSASASASATSGAPTIGNACRSAAMQAAAAAAAAGPTHPSNALQRVQDVQEMD